MNNKKAVIFIISFVIVTTLSALICKKFINKNSPKVVSAKSNNFTKQNEKYKKSKCNKKTPHQQKYKKVSESIPLKDRKNAYLTFDDGPSKETTPKILEILKKYDIKATFFVIGKHAEENKDLLLKEFKEGHSIANHTYDHNVPVVYSSSASIVNEFKKGEDVIKSIIPTYNSKIIRLPGGAKYRPVHLKNAVISAGYHYFDWNCLSKDAEPGNSAEDSLMKNLISTFHNQKDLIVLMHDSAGKQGTINILGKFIEFLDKKGYVFQVLK